MSNKIIVTIDGDLEELIPGFMENRAKDIKKLKDFLQKREFDSIQRLGHSMKGFGAGYGFDRISEIGYHLEFAANNEDEKEIELYIEELKKYLDQVEIVYEN